MPPFKELSVEETRPEEKSSGEIPGPQNENTPDNKGPERAEIVVKLLGETKALRWLARNPISKENNTLVSEKLKRMEAMLLEYNITEEEYDQAIEKLRTEQLKKDREFVGSHNNTIQ